MKHLYLIVGCAILSTSALADGTELAGSEWGYAGDDLPFIQFGTDARASGNSGCNRFTGRYTTGDGEALTIGPLAVTRKACPEPAMSEETRFLAILADARAYRIDGANLQLLGTDGQTLADLVRRDND